MSGITQRRDIGAFVKQVLGIAPTTVVAGSGGDNVAQFGPEVVRSDIGGGLSATVSLPAIYTVTDDLAVSAVVQHRASATADWADYVTIPATTYTTATAATALKLAGVDLSGALDRVRLGVTANFESADTDTITLAGVLTFEGGDEL